MQDLGDFASAFATAICWSAILLFPFGIFYYIRSEHRRVVKLEKLVRLGAPITDAERFDAARYRSGVNALRRSWWILMVPLLIFLATLFCTCAGLVGIFQAE